MTTNTQLLVIAGSTIKTDEEGRYCLNDLHKAAKFLIRNAKQMALRYGLPFDLTEDDIVIPARCPVLGIPLVFHEGNFKDDSPSLAKFIPEKGYVRGNVAVISHKANVMKSSATIQEVESLQEVEALLRWVQSVAQSA